MAKKTGQYSREQLRKDNESYEQSMKEGVVGEQLNDAKGLVKKSGKKKKKDEDVGAKQTAEVDDLVVLSNRYLDIAKPLHAAYFLKQNRNERYYLGDQLDDARMDKYSSQVIINKIFEIVDTLMPRYTGNLPSPQVLLPENGISAEAEIQYGDYMRKMEDVMLAIAEESGTVKALKQFQQYFLLYYLGVLKFGFDEDDEKKIWVEAVRPQRIFIPPQGEIDWVIEYHSDTVRDLCYRFPEKEKEILKYVQSQAGEKELKKGTKLGYYEFTTCEYKWWKLGDCILEVVSNPHYNFDDEKKNFWTKPKLDYIFSDMYTLGMNGYAQTTIVDQLIVQQDALNKRKRQIDEAADRANGVMIAYGAAGVTKEEVAEIEAARKRPNGVVFLDKANQGAIQEFGGKQLPPIVFEDMQDTRSSVDNIAGTHSTLRGEKSPGEETFGGRQLLREGDLDRIAEGVQMIERVCEELYKAFAQLIKVHFDKEEFIPYLGKDGTNMLFSVDRKLIKDGLKIRVRQGSTTVKGKTVVAQEALQLWQQKGIDPISFFERIGDPNPFRTAERLYLWEKMPDVLFKEAAAQYNEALQTTKETNVVKSVMEAGIENKSLALGHNVPPNPNATAQHLDVHTELLSALQTQGLLTPQVAAAIKEHMMAEIAIVSDYVKKEEQAMNEKESGLISRGLGVQTPDVSSMAPTGMPIAPPAGPPTVIPQQAPSEMGGDMTGISAY